jgi:divinyl chlorophyllide a 8-vinyl-reductase
MNRARKRIILAGATGHIGLHVAHELSARGHEVVCLARPRAGMGGAMTQAETRASLSGMEVRFCDVCDPDSLRDAGVRGESFDVVVSCLATRTGAADDAWRVEHAANANLLKAGKEAGATHFILLSAICVQRPKLAFQNAKLAFERELMASGLVYSIVRPTAFFKSLAGQVRSVQRGRPFVFFGNGEGTSCKPIGERDLARFMADCLVDAEKQDAVLPIGGPGEPITPRQQADLLFELLGQSPRYRRVPVAVLDVAILALSLGGRVIPRLRDKAELARIGRFYATESMLVFDSEAQRYDADATPSTGEETLRDFYARVLEEGLDAYALGDHAVFDRGG